jgi:hypothetical protein
VAHTDAYPGLRAMLDGTARPGTPPELLSFSDWDAIASPARDAIETSPLITDDEIKDDIKYVWPTVRDHLTQCGVLIGPSGIEIRPYHPPTTLNSQYSRAKQRIYRSPGCVAARPSRPRLAQPAASTRSGPGSSGSSSTSTPMTAASSPTRLRGCLRHATAPMGRKPAASTAAASMRTPSGRPARTSAARCMLTAIAPFRRVPDRA